LIPGGVARKGREEQKENFRTSDIRTTEKNGELVRVAALQGLLEGNLNKNILRIGDGRTLATGRAAGRVGRQGGGRNIWKTGCKKFSEVSRGGNPDELFFTTMVGEKE